MDTIYTLTGPDLLSVRDQVAVLERALGKTIATVDVSPEDIADRYRASGASAEFVDAVREGTKVLRSGGAAVHTDDVERILGRPPRTFKAWVEEHLAFFRAPSTTEKVAG